MRGRGCAFGGWVDARPTVDYSGIAYGVR